MSDKRLTIRLDPTLRKKLRALADATGKSESDVVREALESYLPADGAGPTCYDLARDLGIIGAAKGLPPDLSINLKLMESFGEPR